MRADRTFALTLCWGLGLAGCGEDGEQPGSSQHGPGTATSARLASPRQRWFRDDQEWRVARAPARVLPDDVVARLRKPVVWVEELIPANAWLPFSAQPTNDRLSLWRCQPPHAIHSEVGAREVGASKATG